MTALLRLQPPPRRLAMIVIAAALIIVLVALTSSRIPPCLHMVVAAEDPSVFTGCFNNFEDVFEWVTNGELVIPPGTSETEIHDLYNAYYFAKKNAETLPVPTPGN